MRVITVYPLFIPIAAVAAIAASATSTSQAESVSTGMIAHQLTIPPRGGTSFALSALAPSSSLAGGVP